MCEKETVTEEIIDIAFDEYLERYTLHSAPWEPADYDLPLVDAGVDSLDVYELAMYLEERFEIVIPDGDIEAASTLNDFKRIIMGLLP